ncbi:MAG: alpha/beta hydrolase [Gammaproteobacteria bacterium]|nr:MAG: alpha/beta hydrolase [Gammaproteobacteria bacterium]RLA12965.1 MAG: alpha/beta hydrolase [Gammaproteobacteria bacterium]RLA14432.1 MAG: alpha/beta hydrolase [Gammaproteobacteria bacterium]
MRSLRSYFVTTLLRVVFKRQKPGALPLQKQRDDFVKMMARSYKPQPGVSCQAGEIGGVLGEWSRHADNAGQRTVLYLHGGGYILGCAEAYRDLTGRLAIAAQADVFAADYRLAPEHPFPAALEDALACYRALISDGIPAAAITIAGDSAGGGLTLATLAALRDAGDQLPAAAVCLSPWSDLTASGESLSSNAKADPMLTPAALAYMAGNYIGEQDASDPRISPCLGDLNDLPPLLVQVGSSEILLDDSRRVANKIITNDGQATLEVWDGMPHVWQMFASLVPEGRQAITRIGQFIQAKSKQ